MNKLIELKNNIWKWANDNPKKIYKYAIGFLLLSIITSIVLQILTPSSPPEIIAIPKFSNKSEVYTDKLKDNRKEMETIVEELKSFQEKHKKGALTKEDSIRIDYLYNHYNKLKNGL